MPWIPASLVAQGGESAEVDDFAGELLALEASKWLAEFDPDANITASTVAGVASIPAPTVTTGGGSADVSPSTVVGVASIPSVTFLSSALVSPTTVVGTATVPGVGITAGGDATASPSVVAGSTGIPTPTVTTGDEEPEPPDEGDTDFTALATGSGDVFTVRVRRDNFDLTYEPVAYSEHVTVSIDNRSAMRKLRRGSEWTRNYKSLLISDEEDVFRGDGPWTLECQYAYGGPAGATDPSQPPPIVDPTDPGYIPPPPSNNPPPPGATLYGSSPNGSAGGSKQSLVQYQDSIFGGINVLRAFDGAFPATWSQTNTARFAPRNIPVIHSFKPGIPSTASGNNDEQLRTYLRSIPLDRDIYDTIQHEPEDNSEDGAYTPAQWRQAIYKLLEITAEIRQERGGMPRYRVCTILMSHTLTSNKRNPADWYVPEVDVLGFDTYNRANLTALRDYSISKGKPWMVCEIGCKPVANYNDAQYADELEAMRQIWTGGSTQPVAVCYFQANVGDNYVITPETRPISVAYWRSLCTTGGPP